MAENKLLEKRKETVGGMEWIEIGVFNTWAICLVPRVEEVHCSIR
jgi:hypothetical protein